MRLRVPEHELTVPHWPERLDGLRIALVADLHAGGPNVREDAIDEVVDRVNEARPDVIALLGDYVDPEVIGARRIEPAAVAQRLARLQAPVATAAVLGNHDWRHEGHGMAAALRHAGVRVLENEAFRADARGGPLWLAGLADFQEREPSVSAALAPVPEGEPVILLSHNPDSFPHVPRTVSLTLSGHTHGAQIDIPGLRGRVIPSRHGTRFQAGHVVEGGRHLFVSRGVGETGYPIRFLAPAEIPMLRLLSPDPSMTGG